MKLSILICTLPKRKSQLDGLIESLSTQISKNNLGKQVEIIVDSDEAISIGVKRNILLSKAKGEYLCFIDDDDAVADYYIEELFKAIDSKRDCASLKGVITWDGENPQVFEHSLKYKEYRNDLRYQEVAYERYPNHLNCIKSSIAKQISFTDKNHSEDTDFADELFKSGLIQSEYYIDKILYYYRYAREK